MKRRPFFLLEILIALGLLSFLFAALFSFWVHFTQVEQKLEKIRREVLPLQQMRVRLNLLFSALIPPHNHPNFPATFYRDDLHNELIMVFDNGVDPDPFFSGAVRARLYLEGGNLCLERFPLGQEGDARFARREILRTGVEQIGYQFFHVKPLYKGGQGGWQTQWPEKREELPCMVRLTLQRTGAVDDEKFAFFIPIASSVATYK